MDLSKYISLPHLFLCRLFNIIIIEQFIKRDMPLPVPPAELPASLVDAFAKLDMSKSKNNAQHDSHSHQLIKREEQEEEPFKTKRYQTPFITEEEPVNATHPSSTKKEQSRSSSIIKKESVNDTNHSHHHSNEDLVYTTTSIGSRKTGWYFAHHLDMTSARNLGPVMLPDGTTVSELRPRDVAVLRQARWMALRGIAVVYWDNGDVDWDNSDVVKGEMGDGVVDGSKVDVGAMEERLRKLKE
ncbi:hypothetical protein TI39_contig4171g00001 [Zymoseptoria brevis]|uniref:Uncharacterized protein n=1 Tax=Zymoseptoria brevis TaxID=1047168 RepID=A0A0F4GEL2_9PEZI|nr:hypothetical protein TI39_contig4171g00001 [Zymoseptoria brevis]